MSGPKFLPALEIEARKGTNYPAAMAKAVEGRAKRVLGDQFGLDQFGVNLTTLEPGSWSAQRHWHMHEDEFVYVLSGELVLIDDSGEHVLKPGDCAGFKAGVPNGHHLANKSSAPATYLEIGTRSPVEEVDYPDIDMKAEKAGGAYRMTRKDGTPF